MRMVILLSALALALGCNNNGRQTPPTEPDSGGAAVFTPYALPAFSLTERHGQTVTNETLKGKVWVASFVFTRCTGPCPRVTATFAKLQAELLADRPNMRLVTISVDPSRDTPEKLVAYAKTFSAHETNWLFLTGKEKETHTLLNEGFKVLTERNKDGKPGEEFDHSSKLLLVNKQGEVCGIFEGDPVGRNGDDTAKARYEQGLQNLKQRLDEELAK